MRFVPFVLTEDGRTMAGAEFGRCDREQSCGYFRYPSGVSPTWAEKAVRKPEPPKEPVIIPREVYHAEVRWNNTLLRAYAPLIGEERLIRTMDLYMCGTGSRGECLYPQYDGIFLRTAKAILYGADGHRLNIEDGGFPVYWLHKSPWLVQWTADRELKQCLFGQHLLLEFNNAEVWIVEAEKTAVLMAATDDRTDRIWLACGGSQMLKGAIDLDCLKGREVTLVPDDGQYWNWKRTADAHGWKCWDISTQAASSDWLAGCDIWDLKEYKLRPRRYDIQ